MREIKIICTNCNKYKPISQLKNIKKYGLCEDCQKEILIDHYYEEINKYYRDELIEIESFQGYEFNEDAHRDYKI